MTNQTGVVPDAFTETDLSPVEWTYRMQRDLVRGGDMMIILTWLRCIARRCPAFDALPTGIGTGVVNT